MAGSLEELFVEAFHGVGEIVLTPKPEYIEAMTNWEDPLYQRIIAALPRGAKPSDYITSLDISARR